jgi:CxxC-x17-CxxC domain-containing protein
MSVCIECNNDFELNEGEKNFYVQRGLDLPKRCKPCRASRKEQINGDSAVSNDSNDSNDSNSVLSDIYCDNCGRESRVPFKPQANRKAYCRVCWNGIKHVGVAAEFV